MCLRQRNLFHYAKTCAKPLRRAKTNCDIIEDKNCKKFPIGLNSNMFSFLKRSECVLCLESRKKRYKFLVVLL